MTQESFSPQDQFFPPDSTTQPSQQTPQFDRSELFALGAAAGAVVAAAISQYLESRQPKTALEQAQEQGSQALDTLKDVTTAGKKQVQGTVDRVGEQLQATFGAASGAQDDAKGSSKTSGFNLRGALGTALGGAAASGLADRRFKRAAAAALERAGEDPYAVSGSVEETLKAKLDESSNGGASKQGGLGATLKSALGFGTAPESVTETLKEKLDDVSSTASTKQGGLGATLKGVFGRSSPSSSVTETLQEKLDDVSSTASTKQGGLGTTLKSALGFGAAAKAADSVIGDPYAVSGSVEETLKEQIDTAGSGRGLGDSLKGLVTTASDATKSYAQGAQSYVKDAQLGDKARQYTGVAAEKTKDLVTTAQKSLKEAQLDKRAREVGGTLAEATSEAAKVTGKAAKQSATKLSAGASQLAEATSEQATELRKGVSKGVKRTRRRTKWGIRSFIVGLAVGLLAAPRSGQSTRATVTTFVEDLLDVFISGEERSPISQ